MKRFATAAAGLATYIANNADAITNHRARWHNGERISTAFVEATVTVVVSRRFCHGRQRHPGRGSRRSGLIISHSLACSHLLEFSGHPEEVALFGKNGPSPRATARNLPRPSKLSHSKDFEPPDGYIRHHLA